MISRAKLWKSAFSIALVAASCSQIQLLEPSPTPNIPSDSVRIFEENREQTLTGNLQTGEPASSESTSSNLPLTYAGQEAVVTRVVDGDTVDVIFADGSTERVRLLGIDTPETFSPNNAYEYEGVTNTSCLDDWGGRASQFAKTMLEGQTINVISDPGANGRDVYGRLLAYIQLNGKDFNATMVRNGFARVYTEGQSSRMAEYISDEVTAQSNAVGLWDCDSLSQSSKPPQTIETAMDCEPSYPTICLPPPPPDLSCADVPYRRFQVVPPDPHRLDGDRDRVGCER